MKVAELTGSMLDYWVAKAEGLDIELGRDGKFHGSICEPSGEDWYHFSPSTEWQQGGPLIERERISITERGNDGWIADAPGAWCVDGQTPLQAAMRAYVIAKHGEEVPADFSA